MGGTGSPHVYLLPSRVLTLVCLRVEPSDPGEVSLTIRPSEGPWVVTTDPVSGVPIGYPTPKLETRKV